MVTQPQSRGRSKKDEGFTLKWASLIRLTHFKSKGQFQLNYLRFTLAFTVLIQGVVNFERLEIGRGRPLGPIGGGTIAPFTSLPLGLFWV